ncbi:MAG TPA: type II secretion system F family protein [bacterium]|nr:type II secretion system F family protein [bacterium]
MKKYKVRFIDGSGVKKEESIFFENQTKIAEYAAANQLYVYQAIDLTASELKTNLKEIKTKPKNLMLFTWQLAVMLNSGSMILESLKLINKQFSDVEFRGVISQIIFKIENGLLFSAALSDYPNIFSSTFIAAIKSGEASGKLPEVLDNISSYIERRETLKNKLKTILIYPSVLFTVAVCGIIFLLMFVLPKFVRIFSSLGITSATINILTTLTGFLENYAFPFLALIVLAAIIVYASAKIFNKRDFFDMLILKIPFIGILVKKVNISFFANTLQILLDSGTPIAQAVIISAETMPNIYISKRILKIIPNVENGEPLNKCLEKTGQFSDIALHMIYVGENSGTLTDMLGKVNNFYNREVEYTVTETLAIVEPAILVLLGAIVCMIAISIFLPINDFISAMHRR